MTRHVIFAVIGALLATTPPAEATRLEFSFLPPDLPPGDVCVARQEENDAAEIQDADIESSGGTFLDDTGRVQFLRRDIRALTRDGAEPWFDYISELISLQAELDPEFAGVNETLQRIDLYLRAGRGDELREAGLIEALNTRRSELNRNQQVQLARFYRTGIGVDQDTTLAQELIVDAAFAGNANALREVLEMLHRGEEVPGWTADLEETATLAFGGMIGQFNRGLCNRAERMAREYIDGDILVPNADIAFAWRKFAADMGGPDAAWRVVEHHLNETGERKDDDYLARYLRIALGTDETVRNEDARTIIEAGARSEEEVRRILGFNYGRSGSARRANAIRFLELDVNPSSPSISEQDAYFDYLTEVAAIPNAPGPVLTRLAKETLLRKGRWAGADDATPLLRSAIELGDPEAHVLLADILLGKHDNGDNVREAERLLTQAVTRYGYVAAMAELDALFRCRLSDAPQLPQATHWANAFRATGVEHLSASAQDIATLDARDNPAKVARIQSSALAGHSGSMANFLQLLQSDPLVSEATLREWSRRVGRSNVALKAFANQTYDLAQSPAERDAAIEFLRRVYLDIGPTVSLDLALALIEHSENDPVTKEEVESLLEASAARGQGAAMRLLQRLTNADPESYYLSYADAINDRGDFLGLMVLAPYVDDSQFDAHMHRAIASMNCTSKDVAEIADAYAMRGRANDVLHWLQIGLAIEGGHTLSKLGLSDQQMAAYGTDPVVRRDSVDTSGTSDQNHDALRLRYLDASDPAFESYDADQAGTILTELMTLQNSDLRTWSLSQYRKATPAIRTSVDGQIDMDNVYLIAARDGDPQAQFEYGMVLRARARSDEDLAQSTRWLRDAAEAGNPEAMAEFAFALGFGLGTEPDPSSALIWLERAEGLRPGIAGDRAAIFEALAADQ